MPRFIINWFWRLIYVLNRTWLFVRNMIRLDFTKQSDLKQSDLKQSDTKESDMEESDMEESEMEESENDCKYDSTWEDEIKPRKKKSHKESRRNEFAARDMQAFRHSCQDLDVNPDQFTSRNKSNEKGGRIHFHSSSYQDDFHNLKFYQGLRRSEPDNLHIDEFHQYWSHDYERLENVHSYIQWLFPIQEQGMNWQAHVLTRKEISLFRRDATARDNLVKSYELMLDFYGIRLVNKKTGEVTRAANWEERSKNLNRNTHNNLRITRILKCLGTLGFQHYQAPLVKFFLIETLQRGTLPKVKKSVLDYFLFSILDKAERKELVRFAFKHFSKDPSMFVWGPGRILRGAAGYAHRENETACAAVKEPIDYGQNSNVDEGSITKQERRGTASPTRYTTEHATKGKKGQNNKPSSHTEWQNVKDVNQPPTEASGKRGSKKGSPMQAKQTSKSVTPSEQTTNENSHGGQGSQLNSNGAEVPEEKTCMEITPSKQIIDENNE